MDFLTKPIYILGLILLAYLWMKYKNFGKPCLTKYKQSEINSLRERIDQQSQPGRNKDLRPLNTKKTLISEKGMKFTI